MAPQELQVSSQQHRNAPPCLDVPLKDAKQQQDTSLVQLLALSVIAAVVLLLLTKNGAAGRPAAIRFSLTQHYGLLSGPKTDAPMAVLPPFEPTCFVIHEERVKVCNMFKTTASCRSGKSSSC